MVHIQELLQRWLVFVGLSLQLVCKLSQWRTQLVYV